MEDYNQSEAQIHKASQFIAIWANHFLPKQEDDSHTTFQLNNKKLVGKRVNWQDSEMSLQLDLQTFTLEWIQNNSSFKTIDLKGKLVQEIQNELNEISNSFKDGDLKSLHYHHAKGYFESDTIINKPGDNFIATWIQHRASAKHLLKHIEKFTGVKSDIQIWPHHFDTGTFYPINANKSIGCGWAIADTLSAQPYFYAAVYENGFDYSHKPNLTKGHWKLNQWKGAILPLSEISNFQDCLDFFETVIRFYLG